jgi:hypothetical protein
MVVTVTTVAVASMASVDAVDGSSSFSLSISILLFSFLKSVKP